MRPYLELAAGTFALLAIPFTYASLVFALGY